MRPENRANRGLPGEVKADIKANSRGPDRGESEALMEPLLIGEGSRHRGELADLAVELAAGSAGFRRSLPDGVLTALAGLVRLVNCYYSNLIEGHVTHPVDIERALNNDYSPDVGKRNLQLEARAHVAVQQWIDAGGLRGRATTIEAILEVHRRFGELLPDELLWVEDPSSGERVRVVPGELRHRDVKVGSHVAVSPGAVPRLLRRFERGDGGLGKTDAILSVAAAHHRLLWIHPFLDGNGRGHLSEEAVARFTRFFLEVCLDQVAFMEGLVQPDRLRARILLWAEEETRVSALPPKAGSILEAVLDRGELPRGDIGPLLGTTDRHARRVVAALVERGVLTGIISSPGGGTTIRNMLAGNLIYSEPSLAAVVSAVQSGADIKIISGNAHTVSDIAWVTMPGSPIKSLKDLKGKRLGFTNPGSTTQALTLLLLEKAGLTRQDVTMIATGGFGPGLTALETGGVDIMALTEPLTSRDAGKYNVVIWAKDVFPPMNNVVGVTTTKAMRNRPEAVKCVITARRKAVEFMYANPKEAATIIAKAYKMDEAVIEKAVTNLINGSVQGVPYWGPGKLHYEGMDNMIRAQRLVGAVKGDVDWSKLVDESLLPDDLKSNRK